MRLSESRIREIVKITRKSSDGSDLYGICPYCLHDEWGISLQKDNHPFSCFRKKACGVQGNIYTLLSLFKIRESDQFTPNDLLNSFDNEEESVLKELPIVTPPVGWKRVYSDPYLIKRGFSEEQFYKYEVGRSFLKQGYVTVLVKMDSKVVAYLSRSVKSKQEIDQLKKTGRNILRYDNSMSDFSKMLFGYDDIVKGKTNTVILTEGWLSKTKTDLNLDLDNCDDIKCVATFGAKISEHQIQLLLSKKIKNIVIWFESDVLQKNKKIVAQLNCFFNAYASYIPFGIDPNDFDRQQAMDCLDSAIEPTKLLTNYL